jgi:hypothetical protein
MGVSRSADKVLRSRAGALKASLTPSNKPIFRAEDDDLEMRPTNANASARTKTSDAAMKVLKTMV